MKVKFLSLFFLLFIALSFTFLGDRYDEDYVQISTVKHNNYKYKMVYMQREASGRRIKAKYFAAKDYNGTTVPERYKSWSSNKDIICVTSGTYMSDCNVNLATPVGLTIESGVLVNKSMANFDGLVIVYATGGIVATNLKNKDLKVSGGSISGIPLDLPGNTMHRNGFIDWCKDKGATVFQTHLLAYKNQLKVGANNSSTTKRERRFLAVGYDDEGKLIHCIVHSPTYTTLYDGSKRVLEFLNEFKDMNVTYMLNLDTGCQNVFELYNSNGSLNNTIKGENQVKDAANLLVYYYE